MTTMLSFFSLIDVPPPSSSSLADTIHPRIRAPSSPCPQPPRPQSPAPPPPRRKSPTSADPIDFPDLSNLHLWPPGDPHHHPRADHIPPRQRGRRIPPCPSRRPDHIPRPRPADRLRDSHARCAQAEASDVRAVPGIVGGRYMSKVWGQGLHDREPGGVDLGGG